ncbi:MULTISPECIES: DUF2752 domain-containing protein [unclassified Micromonospora]|uniref:DUF2752 domain-containing protein n=1 Tax=unclassified Micromonospora TaxID=2617518 RepID=UPI001B3989D2|nr:MULTISPECIES: DUF2752 domain-containing protein [unclassified Micromonospora]MBQ1042268.1 DUF2752 domain-containing protein [Micromonospora sp. C72]MBQ1056196.1 DUF2752 domain-containing protein [Micromonospora sp. C32]
MYGERVTSVDRPATEPDPHESASSLAHAGAHAHAGPHGHAEPHLHAGPHGHAGPHAPAGGPDAPWQGPHPVAYQPVETDRFTRMVLRLHARAPRWAVPLAALGCVALGLAYALISNPTVSDPDARPTCLLKLTTGLDCPGCGGTRALWYVLHGDLPAAARHHFLFVFALPFLTWLFVAWAGNRAFGWKLPEARFSPKVIGLFLAAWGVFSVARNLPWAPFTSLYV